MSNSIHLERQAGALLATIPPQVHSDCRHLFVIIFLAVHKIATASDEETTFQVIQGIYKAVFFIEIPRASPNRLRLSVGE